jgi:hypothetical protein
VVNFRPQNNIRDSGGSLAEGKWLLSRRMRKNLCSSFCCPKLFQLAIFSYRFYIGVHIRILEWELLNTVISDVPSIWGVTEIRQPTHRANMGQLIVFGLHVCSHDTANIIRTSYKTRQITTAANTPMNPKRKKFRPAR